MHETSHRLSGFCTAQAVSDVNATRCEQSAPASTRIAQRRCAWAAARRSDRAEYVVHPTRRPPCRRQPHAPSSAARPCEQDQHRLHAHRRPPPSAAGTARRRWTAGRAVVCRLGQQQHLDPRPCGRRSAAVRYLAAAAALASTSTHWHRVCAARARATPPTSARALKSRRVCLGPHCVGLVATARCRENLKVRTGVKPCGHDVSMSSLASFSFNAT